jgi:adenylate cyclase
VTSAPSVVRGAIAFTDIVGFTEYTALRGDEEALGLLAVQERIVQATLPPGSRLVKELGDGLLLWFDGAADAVNTCLDLQAAFESESAKSDFPLWVRMGLHWGAPFQRGADLIGHDVNLTSRIVNVAGPGELVLSEAAKTAAEDGCPNVAFEELGPVVLKGIPTPVPLFRASREP